MKFKNIIITIILGIFIVSIPTACSKSESNEKVIDKKVKDKKSNEVIVDDSGRKNIKLSDLKDCKKGSYVEMGKYYNKPILWECRAEDENGKLLVSKYVICQKAFDASETGDVHKADANGVTDGSNVWSNSNLREWLNSDEKEVKYTTGKPVKKAVFFSPYDKEAGFLTNFTDEEKTMINQIKHDGVEDKIFLLSQDEFENCFKIKGEDSIDPDGSNTAVKRLTNEAIKNSGFPQDYLGGKGKWHYWTRTPYERTSFTVVCVDIDNSFNIARYSACHGDVGVVPALYIK